MNDILNDTGFPQTSDVHPDTESTAFQVVLGKWEDIAVGKNPGDREHITLTLRGSPQPSDALLVFVPRTRSFSTLHNDLYPTDLYWQHHASSTNNN